MELAGINVAGADLGCCSCHILASIWSSSGGPPRGSVLKGRTGVDTAKSVEIADMERFINAEFLF